MTAWPMTRISLWSLAKRVCFCGVSELSEMFATTVNQNNRATGNDLRLPFSTRVTDRLSPTMSRPTTGHES